MKKLIKNIVIDFVIYISLSMLIFGIIVIITAVGVEAQGIQERRIELLEERINAVRDEQLRRGGRIEQVENRVEKLHELRLDQRLIVLETIAQTNRTLILGTALAVIPMFIKTMFDLITSISLRRKNNRGGQL